MKYLPSRSFLLLHEVSTMCCFSRESTAAAAAASSAVRCKHSGLTKKCQKWFRYFQKCPKKRAKKRCLPKKALSKAVLSPGCCQLLPVQQFVANAVGWYFQRGQMISFMSRIYICECCYQRKQSQGTIANPTKIFTLLPIHSSALNLFSETCQHSWGGVTARL